MEARDSKKKADTRFPDRALQFLKVVVSRPEVRPFLVKVVEMEESGPFRRFRGEVGRTAGGVSLSSLPASQKPARG